MKKFKVLFIMLLLLISFVSVSFSEVVLNSPQEIGQYIHDNIQYTRDVTDHWQRPEETLTRGKGDCEDIALLAKYYLNNIGIKTRIVIFTGTRDGQERCHCICVFLENDGTYSQVGQGYFYVHGKTVRDVVVDSATRLKYDEIKEIWIMDKKDVEKKIEETEYNN